MLLREIKNIFHKELDSIYGKEETASFFFLLIEHYFGLERFILALQPDYIINKTEESQLFRGLNELKTEKPIQYITGTTHFMDLEFNVASGVLIPRPETEELVRWVLEDYQDLGNSGIQILDIGTGSGCIAVSLAKNLPKAKISALDLSKKALIIARENAVKNRVDINFIERDILKSDIVIDQKFNVIVSNPPYVRKMEKKDMRKNVLVYEPDMALFVDDETPLLFYGHILEFTKDHLVSEGWIYLEINQYLGQEMVTLLEKHNFKKIELKKDMFGNDRMIKAKKG
ncbi:peptide chain release factor N(5)-glutamine methyltransferase [Maribacter sp. 2210JD10-5]|uniref:peptide chain release factor N(5)-glutamine methyltransferase n=1 Tax=Maribacter sp. 2210JD10-5 TaxID=3386272 RepID=UPI0039BC7C9C